MHGEICSAMKFVANMLGITVSAVACLKVCDYQSSLSQSSGRVVQPALQLQT